MNAADPSSALPPPFAAWPRDRAMFDAGGVVILMYHKIARVPAASNLPALYVEPGQFERHMAALTGAGLRCLPYSDAPAAIQVGERGFCVTFDDGFRSAFENALPVLRARGLRAIQFIVAGQIGGEDAWDRALGEPPQPLMDERQIREWLAAGQEIGSHTLTHPRLTALPRERARAEIFDSKKALEDRFGVPVRHFCYPYGDSDAATRGLVAEAGYESAPTVEFGTNRPGAPPFGLRRVMARNAPSLLRTLRRGISRLARSRHP